MTKRYTADDFANARFAEHPNPETVDAQYAARMSTNPRYPWLLDGVPGNTDSAMAKTGWVPVPTKPTITTSQFEELSEGLKNRTTILACALERAGIAIVPDPEPTNTDRLERLIRESGLTISDNGIEGYAAELAASLDEDGVTAPNVKGN